VKASGAATSEAYTLTEAELPPGLGAPQHVHEKHEEAFYVLDGRISFVAGDQEIHATAGDFILVPRGIAHSFNILGDAPARYLCIFSPPATQEERDSLKRQLSQVQES
jgi:quercetin dioxygenase-like cupin family protein